MRPLFADPHATRQWRPRAAADEIARSALDALDVGVLVVDTDLDIVVQANRQARAWVGIPMSAAVREAIAACVRRRAVGQRTPSCTVSVGERALRLKVTPHAADSSLEVVVIEPAPPAPDRFELLRARYGLGRHEALILDGLRLGKSPRELARELGSTEAQLAREVHRLMVRFCVPTRERLVEVVEAALTATPVPGVR